MLNVLRQIHPHVRLWIVSAITLGILLIINTPVEKTVDTPVEKTVKIYKQPQGRVVAYYNKVCS
jgi:diacylglycerol kinase